MKSSKETIKNYLSKFINWLQKSYFYQKSSNSTEMVKFKSHSNYEKYMILALQDLGFTNPEHFFKASLNILEKFFATLTKSVSFNRRSEKQQSDITSAFKCYILYVTKNQTF